MSQPQISAPFDELLQAAKAARNRAYAPISQFRVGAAVLDEKLGTFSGGNVESGSLFASICAERVAIANAVLAGGRNLVAIAVIGNNPKRPVTPCALCRQLIAEFLPEEGVVLCGMDANEAAVALYSVAALVPYPATILRPPRRPVPRRR